MDKKQAMIKELKDLLGNITFNGNEIPQVQKRFWHELENSSLKDVQKLYQRVIEIRTDS